MDGKLDDRLLQVLRTMFDEKVDLCRSAGAHLEMNDYEPEGLPVWVWAYLAAIRIEELTQAAGLVEPEDGVLELERQADLGGERTYPVDAFMQYLGPPDRVDFELGELRSAERRDGYDRRIGSGRGRRWTADRRAKT